MFGVSKCFFVILYCILYYIAVYSDCGVSGTINMSGADGWVVNFGLEMLYSTVYYIGGRAVGCQFWPENAI